MVRALTMVPAGNKVKRLLSVNRTMKTIHHLHRYFYNISQHKFNRNNFPQSLGRFGVVIYGKFFMVNWMDSIIERTWFTGMVKRECIRFIFIPSQISSFCGCQTDFSEFIIIKQYSVKLFLTNSASSSTKSIEREEGRGSSETVVNMYTNFYPLLSLKFLYKYILNLYRILIEKPSRSTKFCIVLRSLNFILSL